MLDAESLLGENFIDTLRQVFQSVLHQSIKGDLLIMRKLYHSQDETQTSPSGSFNSNYFISINTGNVNISRIQKTIFQNVTCYYEAHVLANSLNHKHVDITPPQRLLL